MLIILLSTLGGLFFILLLVLVRRHLGALVGKFKVKAELNEHLLEDTKKSLETLTAVWHIQAADVNLDRMVDAGSFGEVWLADWNAMRVSCSHHK